MLQLMGERSDAGRAERVADGEDEDRGGDCVERVDVDPVGECEYQIRTRRRIGIQWSGEVPRDLGRLGS
jgi:hypothetical protein